MALQIARAQVEVIIEHARQEFPNECCGLLAGRQGSVEFLCRGQNIDQSPYTYRLDPREQLQFFKEIDAREQELLGIYHSHTQSEAYPSRTDVAKAYYQEAVYVIVSVREPSAPREAMDVRAFRIRDGLITEEELVVA